MDEADSIIFMSFGESYACIYSFQENIYIINRISPEYLQIAGHAKHLLFKQIGPSLFVLDTNGRIPKMCTKNQRIIN